MLHKVSHLCPKKLSFSAQENKTQGFFAETQKANEKVDMNDVYLLANSYEELVKIILVLTRFIDSSASAHMSLSRQYFETSRSVSTVFIQMGDKSTV